MTEAKAHLKSYRQSPRKVRLVAAAVRGKSAEQALGILSLIPNRAALPLQKLVASALANGKNLGMNAETLVIKEMRVDEGATLYRRRSRSKGMANPIRKRTSHVTIVLGESKAKK
ncbi:MAG: 50S ribosomal protein L22 [bacterium]|nr:50S ribosomal protein L22 [bacterium]